MVKKDISSAKAVVDDKRYKVVVKVKLPGVTNKDTKIKTKENTLILSATKRTRPKKTGCNCEHELEVRRETYKEEIPLDFLPDLKKIKAYVNHKSELEVTIDKPKKFVKKQRQREKAARLKNKKSTKKSGKNKKKKKTSLPKMKQDFVGRSSKDNEPHPWFEQDEAFWIDPKIDDWIEEKIEL